MIASVTGTVQATTSDAVVVEVGGIGIQVLTTPATAASLAIGEVVALATNLVVREDSLTLYGFLQPVDRDAFQILQSVSGIGPRIALAALATYSADELRNVVAHEDEAALTRISGIGKKGAQRLILELADKLGPVVGSASSASILSRGRGAQSSWQGQVRDALTGLGWSLREAEEAVAAAQSELGDSSEAVEVPDMLARVLRGMSRR